MNMKLHKFVKVDGIYFSSKRELYIDILLFSRYRKTVFIYFIGEYYFVVLLIVMMIMKFHLWIIIS